MTDIVPAHTRSKMMATIRGKDTKPEMALRRSLHAAGVRYRLHVKGLPGKPDLVLPRFRAVIFVHGCFWHRHPCCRFATRPATRPEFWEAKFQANIARDAAASARLLADGWRVATVWECSLRSETDVRGSSALILEWLHSGSPFLDLGKSSAPERGAPVPSGAKDGRAGA